MIVCIVREKTGKLRLPDNFSRFIITAHADKATLVQIPGTGDYPVRLYNTLFLNFCDNIWLDFTIHQYGSVKDE
jgi:hypothetical protein